MCGEGEYCCNESCGICLPVGESCISSICPIDCAPQDVAAGPACLTPTVLGYAWNGAACAPLASCECVGADCDGLFATELECQGAWASCMTGPRTCASSADCEPTEYCDFPGIDCGIRGTIGSCFPVPLECPMPDGHRVCGCNNLDYSSACEATAAGTDVLIDGPCHPCDREDAEAAAGGTCGTIVGIVWNGEACVDIVGCSCSGVDCDLATRFDCEARHATCTTGGFACGPDDLRCLRWNEVCVLDPSSYPRCEAIRTDCEADPCTCALGMCSDDLEGGVTIRP